MIGRGGREDKDKVSEVPVRSSGRRVVWVRAVGELVDDGRRTSVFKKSCQPSERSECGGAMPEGLAGRLEELLILSRLILDNFVMPPKKHPSRDLPVI
jgi:hypothetical protein